MDTTTQFLCGLCQKGFANKANLKRHKETHGERKVCPQCHATFSTTDGLKRHRKSQHEQAIGSAPQLYQSTDSPKAPTSNISNLASEIATAVSGSSFSDTIQTSKSTFNTGASVRDVANIISKQGQQSSSSISPAKQSGLQSTCTASKTSPSVAKTAVPPKKPKRFVNPQNLPTYNKETHLTFDVNDQISTPTNGHGTLRYKGDVDFAPGMWAGIELDTPTGRNDGSTKHKRYFQCRPKHGLFLPLAELTKPQAQDRTDSGNEHVDGSSPGNTAQPVHVDITRPTSDSFARRPTQSINVSSNSISQESPSKAKKRCGPLRCNNCEGCKRNQRGEDCRECKYCRDKKKYGGPETLRKPCEKKKCTLQTSPSFKDDNGSLHPKRTFSGIADEDLSAGQGPSIKKKKKGVDMSCDDRFTLKLEKEEAEKKRKKAEKEKQRLEKSLIQARASAFKFKNERDEMEIENASFKKQIMSLKQEVQHIKEMGCREAEEKFKVQKETLEKQLRSLDAEKTHIYQQMTQTMDIKNKVEAELSELKTDKENMVREITKLKTDNNNMNREIAEMKHDKYKMEEKFDQTKAVMLNELQSLREVNENLLKGKSKCQSLRDEDIKLKQGTAASVEKHQESVPSTSYSGTYCDICDVTEHDTEECPEQTFESVSPDGLAQIEYSVSSIPEPVIAPVSVALEQVDSLPIVYFDLETTGLERQSHITQIAAKNTAGHTFDRYVIPKKPISQGAAKATRNTIINGQFYHKERPVWAITVSQALREFFFFIGDSPVILSGHNIKSFDCHVLLNALKSCGMQGWFEKKVAGFLDTMSLFRCLTKPPYKQEKLYERLVGGTYDAHNALEDVKALQELISKINPSLEEKRKHTFSVQYVLDVQEYNRKAAFNLDGWNVLIEKGVVTKHIAQKAAKSGLRPEHLEFSFESGGEYAIYNVLSQITTAGCRVTKDKEISKQLSDYCENRLLGLF